MITFARTSNHDLPLPSRSTELAAGVDLRANLGYLPNGETRVLTMRPGDEFMVPTGWAVDLGTDTVGLLCPRSGLGGREGLVIGNLVGTIDGDFRGELRMALWYRKSEGPPLTITHGDRVAQLVLASRSTHEIVEGVTEDLCLTSRDDAGFGSSGVA